MAPRKKEAEVSAIAPAEEGMPMGDVTAESEGEILMREDPHNPAAMMFQEQRLRIVRAQDPLHMRSLR